MMGVERITQFLECRERHVVQCSWAAPERRDTERGSHYSILARRVRAAP